MKILNTENLSEKLDIQPVSKEKLNDFGMKLGEYKEFVEMLENVISQIGDYVDVDEDNWDEECSEGLKKGFEMLLDLYKKMKQGKE